MEAKDKLKEEIKYVIKFFPIVVYQWVSRRYSEFKNILRLIYDLVFKFVEKTNPNILISGLVVIILVLVVIEHFTVSRGLDSVDNFVDNLFANETAKTIIRDFLAYSQNKSIEGVRLELV